MHIIHEVFDWIGIPILVGIFIILFFVEQRFALRKRIQSKWKRSKVNNLISLPSFVLLRFMFLPVMIWLAIQNKKLHFGLNYLYDLPAVAEAAIAFLILDYGNYLWHILNHKIPALWRFHLVHHIDLDLDIMTATRFHFGEMIGSVFFRGAFVFLTGAAPLTVLIYEIFFEAANQFQHSNWKLPLQLETLINYIFVTPRMHGIHHSTKKIETDSNFSVIFSFWDRLHNTIRLNVHQNEIIIGVPAYQDKEELSAGYLLKLPFTKIRLWKSTDSQPVRENEEKLNRLIY